MLKTNKEQILKLIEACRKNYEVTHETREEGEKVNEEDALENMMYYLDEIKKIVKSE